MGCGKESAAGAPTKLIILMRDAGVALAAAILTVGCGGLYQADVDDPVAPPSDGASSSGSTTREPVDAEFEYASSGTVTGDDSSGSQGTEPAPADLQGRHDGIYVGSIAIEFVSAGTCTGTLTIEVDAAADPPIVGSGECTGLIFGVPEGGETDIDGLLALDGPTGQARQEVDGVPVAVAWQGAFTQSNFSANFEGSTVLFGTPVEFSGVWNLDR